MFKQNLKVLMTNIEMMHHSTLFSSSTYYVDKLYTNSMHVYLRSNY
jgi:hypothetical protein